MAIVETLMNNKLKVGGGAAAVVLAGVLGFSGILGGGSAAKIEALCGPAPAALADASLQALVTEGAKSLAANVKGENFVTDVENGAYAIFAKSAYASRSDVKAAYRHEACALVATNFNADTESAAKYALVQSSIANAELKATETANACVSEKTAALSAEEPVNKEETITAGPVAADGKDVIQTTSVCIEAGEGRAFIGEPTVEKVCTAEANCTVQPVRMATDEKGQPKACVDIEVKNDASLKVALAGKVGKVLTDAQKIDVAAGCFAPVPVAAPVTEPTVVDPAASGTPATETPATEAPAEAPAAPEAAPAAPAEPAPATP
jgi:hypothetical protein